jgi:hypothetical protein
MDAEKVRLLADLKEWQEQLQKLNIYSEKSDMGIITRCLKELEDNCEEHEGRIKEPEADLARYKKAAQTIFDDPVGYMENKSVHWKERAEKAEAELASLKAECMKDEKERRAVSWLKWFAAHELHGGTARTNEEREYAAILLNMLKQP